MRLELFQVDSFTNKIFEAKAKKKKKDQHI